MSEVVFHYPDGKCNIIPVPSIKEGLLAIFSEMDESELAAEEEEVFESVQQACLDERDIPGGPYAFNFPSGARVVVRNS